MTRARFALAAGLLALTADAAAGAAPPRGNPDGLALLERVHRAYRNVPGVAISLRLGTTSFDLKFVLHSGIVVAEQAVVRTPVGTTTDVQRRGGPTFVRDAGRSCWRRLRASDLQAIVDVGLRFPDQPQMRVEAPRRTSTGWRLKVVIKGESAVFVIDRQSMRIRSIEVTTPKARLVEHVSALRSAPRLAVPFPRC